MSDYATTPLSERLEEFDRIYRRAIKYGDLERNKRLMFASIILLKCNAFYDLTEQEKKAVDKRHNSVYKEIDEVTNKLSKQARKRYGPLAFCQLPNPLLFIVQDQEVIEAQRILGSRDVRIGLERKVV